MSTKTYFINSTQASYTDEEFAWLQTIFLSEGLIGDENGDIGMEVEELDTPGMGVQVSIGKALVSLTKDGRTFKVVAESDAIATALITANSSGSNRIDAIILRIDKDAEPNVTKSNIATIETVLGSGVSALTDGAIDTLVGDDGWIRLANITVANGAVSILNSAIADVRTKVQFNEAMGFGEIFIEESAGPGDAGKIPKLDENGELDDSFLQNPPFFDSGYIASDTLLFSNDASVNMTASLTKLKETRIDSYAVGLRVKVSAAASASNYNIFIYVNGVAISGALSGTSPGSTQTYDLPTTLILKPNDLIQIYAQRTAGSSSSVHDFRLYGTLHKKVLYKIGGIEITSPVIVTEETATIPLSATIIS